MPKIDALDQGSSTQRDALNHQAIEDYLKTIYTLAETESPVSTSRIAEVRQVKPASVTSMLQRLDRLNMVNYEKHYGVSLTPYGEKDRPGGDSSSPASGVVSGRGAWFWLG
ncbi:MAG: metal-dependent transcriptional regulator [Chloroflexi bacterium]|nr:metal-dependent transcriptional regulator [Chloroflexota bacterium]